MEVIKKAVRDYKIEVEIAVGKDEFTEDLEQMIQNRFNRFLSDEGIRIVGRPQADDIRYTDGGAVFHVKADLYPEVKLGQYKGILVPFRRGGEQEQFEKAVLQRACENMTGEIPPHMIDQKMTAIIAREKINVSNEAIYHLLADALVILKEAYEMAGAVRPKTQISREAMDLTLQTVSEEHQNDWKEFFEQEISLMVSRYHDLPEDYHVRLKDIIKKQIREKNAMKKDDLIDRIFKAYLGSLELSEEQWKNQRRLQAAKEVCVDLLLDAVAQKERITVSAPELRAAVEEIAEQCHMEPEEVEAQIDKQPLIWKILRDKALVQILDSAGTDEELRRSLAEAKKR